MVLKRGARVRRRTFTPEVIDETVCAHDFVRAQDQKCEEGAPLQAGDLDLSATGKDLERTEDAELHLAATVTPPQAPKKSWRAC